MQTGRTVLLAFGEYRRVPMGIVSLNRPSQPPNQLSTATILELDDVLEKIPTHTKLGLVVIRSGQQGIFGAADMEEIRLLRCNEGEILRSAQEMAQTWKRILEKLRNLWIPVVAIVHGHCTDVGLELALACNVILATPDAKMGFPGLASGLMPRAGGLRRLSAKIGARAAIQMISRSTELLGAEEAVRLGLADRIIQGEPFALLTEAARTVLDSITGQRSLARLWRGARRWAFQRTRPGSWFLARKVDAISDPNVHLAAEILLRATTESLLPGDVDELETQLFARTLRAARP